MTARKLHTVRWPPDGTETTKCIDVQSIHKAVFLYGRKQTYKQPLQCIYKHYIYVYDMLLLILLYVYQLFVQISGICMQGNNYRNFNKLFTCIDDSTTYESENLVDVRNKIYVYYNNQSTTVYCQSTSVNSCSPRVHSQGNVSNFWQMLPNAATEQHVEPYSLDFKKNTLEGKSYLAPSRMQFTPLKQTHKWMSYMSCLDRSKNRA